MKKTAAIIAVCMMALGAYADISVRWSSSTYFLLSGGDPVAYPADYVPTDALHILIWSASAAPTTDYAQPGTGVGAGEIVLWQSPAAMTAGGVFDYGGSPETFTDADVGGSDINSGYLFSRIFSSSSPAASEWYFQSAAVSPNLPEFDPFVIATIMDHVTSSAVSGEMSVGSGMYQVVPEPSVIAFLGLGGLALAARRRFIA